MNGTSRAPTTEQIDEQILAADRETRRLGLTTVHDAGASSRTIEAYRGAEPATDDWRPRLYVMIDGSPATTREWFARVPFSIPSIGSPSAR